MGSESGDPDPQRPDTAGGRPGITAVGKSAMVADLPRIKGEAQ